MVLYARDLRDLRDLDEGRSRGTPARGPDCFRVGSLRRDKSGVDWECGLGLVCGCPGPEVLSDSLTV